jgi:hypothetical protein
MTVDQLVDEGIQFMLAHPSAKRKSVKTHLMTLAYGPSISQERDAMTGAAIVGGSSGCLMMMLLLPIIHMFSNSGMRGHEERVEAALDIIYDDKPKKKKRKREEEE